ncbi:MAG: CAP domain-containing protein [Oscillospiraceae bacterium]|nr:CAP domain-containing protein [Oscillospiraceae bacterium]
MKVFVKLVAVSMIFLCLLGLIQNKVVAEYNQSVENSILSKVEQETLGLINQERTSRGLNILKLDSTLQYLAEEKAEDIVKNNYFAHYSNKYGSAFDMMKSANVEYRVAGENLAESPDIKEAVNAWMNSESHRENILDENFQYTGMAVIKTKDRGYIFVEMFICK